MCFIISGIKFLTKNIIFAANYSDNVFFKNSAKNKWLNHLGKYIFLS